MHEQLEVSVEIPEIVQTVSIADLAVLSAEINPSVDVSADLNPKLEVDA
jgi:hypothetical protein